MSDNNDLTKKRLRPRPRPSEAPPAAEEKPARREKHPFALTPQPRVETMDKPLFAHLPLPNIRHERFVQELAIGTPKAEAYLRAGYDTETPGATANALLRQDDVAARLAHLQAKAADLSSITVADLVRELEDARLSAKALGQTAAMVSATKEKAVLLGLRVEKRDITTQAGDPKGMSDDELARIAKSGSDGADTPPGDTSGPKPVVH